ncbi:MAG: discoidin domain-containing protein [Planctomycetaceae bacterium]|nr:discoidin domain-containing protein [Planctomycetaceae bacterium]
MAVRFFTLLVLSLCYGQVVAQENIALGKKYTMSPGPVYVHCTDPDDIVQLTDGQTTTQHFWTQKGTVGWQGVPFAVVEIDLEKVEPIRGVELTTAAGVAGVAWPRAVFVLVSDDGRTYRNIGNIVAADFKDNGPYPEGYAIRCLSARDMEGRGRFVRIVMCASGMFLFTDEIRIFRGPDSLLQGEPNGKIVSEDVHSFFKQVQIQQAIIQRLILDIGNIRRLLENASGISEEKRTELTRRIDGIDQTIYQLMEEQAFRDPEDFKTIFPYNEPHAELFRIQAEIWHHAGITFRVEAVPTWDETPLFGKPEPKEPEYRINVHALRGEYRAAAINLYNGTQQPVTTNLHIEGIAFESEELTIHDVPWTDTNQQKPVLAALPIVEPNNGVYPITVLPGLVKQVWLTFHPVKLSAGDYNADFIFESDSKRLATVAMQFKVWPLEFPKQTSLLLGGWSYTSADGAYSVNPKNRESFLKHLQERFVNAPWSQRHVLMSFDVVDSKIHLNTKLMDDWLAQWPNAKEYCFFLSDEASFKGIRYDSLEFEAMIAAWITAWAEYWKSKGIEPQQINLCFRDEPGLHPDYDLSASFAWSRAIRKAQPKIKIWTDPVYTDLSSAPKEVFELSDVLCPLRPMWLDDKEQYATFYRDWQQRGKTLQFYSCSGPARLLDPYSYYRLQAWHCAEIGATGSFFWAFGDAGGQSSWNEYLLARNMYTPLFIDPDSETVVAGKQMEAIRESVEDFETIQMLCRLIEQRKAEGKSVVEEEAVLKESLNTVLRSPGVDRLNWEDAKDRTIADQVRFRIIETILSIQ